MFRTIISFLAITGGLFFASPVHAQPEQNRLNILMLDFESPFEMDQWVAQLKLTKEGCSVGVDYCSEWINAYRPLNRTNSIQSYKGALVTWLLDTVGKGTLPAPEIVLISGHHLGGFTGVKGTFYMTEVSRLSENPLIKNFFTHPRFVYLGGCYTVKSRFKEIEGDPVAYVNRVLSHSDIRPSMELLTQAIQQLAQKDPNPWARVFPNAALVGFDKKGPGIDNLARVQHLIEGIVKKLVVDPKSPGLDMLVETQRLYKSHSSSAKGLFANAAHWWGAEGRRLTLTAAKSFLPSSDAQTDVAEDLRDQQQIDSQVAKTKLMELFDLISKQAIHTTSRTTHLDLIYIKQEILRGFFGFDLTLADSEWLEKTLLEEAASNDFERTLFAVQNIAKLPAFGPETEDLLWRLLHFPEPDDILKLEAIRTIGKSNQRSEALIGTLLKMMRTGDLNLRNHIGLALLESRTMNARILSDIVEQFLIEDTEASLKFYLSLVIMRHGVDLTAIETARLAREVGKLASVNNNLYVALSNSPYSRHIGICLSIRKRLAMAGLRTPANLKTILMSCEIPSN